MKHELPFSLPMEGLVWVADGDGDGRGFLDVRRVGDVGVHAR